MRKAGHSAGDPAQTLALGSSQDAIALIASALDTVVRQNHDLRQSQPTSFDAVSAPSISIHRYLTRIRQYTKFHDECYVVALVYLDRLFAAHKAPFLPTPHNVHRLIITSVLVASKFYDDVFHSNSFMAQVGGISVAEMNKLEIELCLRLNWQLHLAQEEYASMVTSLFDTSHVLWKRWRHQPEPSFTSDEEVLPADPVPAPATVRAPETRPPPPPRAHPSMPVKPHMTLWAGGYRTRDASPPPYRRSGPQTSESSPVSSVSVH